MAANCTVEANGVTLECACAGCGIVYDHTTKKYTFLCCGSITTTSVKNQADEVPQRPGHITVDFNNITVLEAARLLDSAAPGKVKIGGSFKQLDKRIRFKTTQPIDALALRLKLSTSR